MMTLSSLQKGQKGLSLIELLIAMVIGLFLLSGIASSYLASKQASVNRNQTSLLEDNGRLALEIITKSLEHTGHAPGVPLNKPFIGSLADDIEDNTCPGGTKNVTNFTTTSRFRVAADDDANKQDTIGVIFHSDANIFTDCGGNAIAVACRLPSLSTLSPSVAPEVSRIYNSFYVDSANKTLECVGSRTTAAVTIADGVENMQFLYGVDNDDDQMVDRYVNATAINASGTDDLDWDGVISIQIAILLRSLKPVKNVAEAKSFTLLDVVVAVPADRFQRAVFSTTIQLRNTL